MDAAEVLSMAIAKEIEAHDLYSGVAERTDNAAARTLLRDLAREEAGHRAALENLSPEECVSFAPPAGQDLKIADYLRPVPLSPDSGLQEVLIHAMKREEEARGFYEAMATEAAEETLRNLLRKL